MPIEVGCFSVTKSTLFEGFPCGQPGSGSFEWVCQCKPDFDNHRNIRLCFEWNMPHNVAT
jgi:hypothetical protein